MKKVLVLLHPGCEEIEAVTPVDLLRRAGAEVVAASVTSELRVRGGRGVAFVADRLLADCADTAFDMLVIPGGPGVEALRQIPEVLYVARKFYREDRFVAAICAAPLVLLDAGILAQHTIACFPGVEEELRGKVHAISQERVYRDGQVITSRGAGSAEEFAFALVSQLFGDAATETLRQQIVAR